ncbi:hypothetical protein CH293_12785 [Rhodococcus sp. 14-2470-1b]|nr:hypothetical protein CH293_12785 [Rhodococcus sp. 14-2470-1b]
MRRGLSSSIPRLGPTACALASALSLRRNESSPEMMSSPHNRFRNLADLGPALVAADDLEQLGDAYLTSVESVFDFPMRALYLFDDGGTSPAWHASRNVSERFMRTYEQLGRPVDHELQQVMSSSAPVYNLSEQSIDQWVQTEIYQRVDRLENMVHVLKAPIVVDGKIIGTIDFASDRVATEVTDVDMQLMAVAAGVVGGAVAGLRKRKYLEDRLASAAFAIEAGSSALVFFSAESNEPVLNPAATRVVGGLQEGQNILFRILRDIGISGDVSHRSYLVRLLNGEKDVLESTIRAVPDRPGAYMLEIALESAESRTRGNQLQSLTIREYDVAGLVAAGFSDKDIADELVLSLHTVRQHVKNIYTKLGISTRVHLARLYHGMASRAVPEKP